MRKLIYMSGAMLIAACLLLGGCRTRQEAPDISAVTPTTGIEPTMEESSPSPAAGTAGDTGRISAGPLPNSTPLPTGEDAAVTGIPDEAVDEEITQAPEPDDSGETATATPDDISDAQPTDAPSVTDQAGPDDGSLTSDPDPADSDIVKEYWSNSFLVWLPVLEHGSYKDTAYDESHDYIMLSAVSEADIEAYIGELTGAGFNIDTGYLKASDFRFGGSLEYTAANADGWEAFIDYDRDTMTAIIGSGYHSVSDDGYQELAESTLLGELPEFTYGTFDSGMNDGSTQYAVFYDVDTECAEYIDQLKSAGFTQDADEGNESGIIWYNAENSTGLVCEFIFTDGMARIGCRKD